MDRTPGRRIWFQFWDTCIRTEAGWFARLHYVMDNPVKHGLVKLPDEWAHGSAVRFLCEATPGEVKRVFSYGCDRVGVPDAF
jgi:putative transposase